MTKTYMATLLMVLGTAAPSYAGGQAGSIGVGAEAELNGVGGVSVNYDAGKFHVGAMLGYRRIEPAGGTSQSETDVGFRGYFHVHSTAMSDFGIGGNIGIASVPVQNGMGMTNRETDVFLEPSFQIRLFVASNVALSFTGGLSIGLGDATTTSIGGQGLGLSTNTRNPFGIEGGAGVHYYFF
jgi:hypothetical protein